MKHGHCDKPDEDLHEAERVLRTELLAILPRVEKTGEQLFLNSTNLPEGYRLNWMSPDAERLYALARECAELRRGTQREDGSSIGELFLAACREAADMDDHHRRGPRKLAAWLLKEIS